MLLLRKAQLMATRLLETRLSVTAVPEDKPNPINRDICMKAQMAHQERKIRRNLPVESGDLAMGLE